MIARFIFLCFGFLALCGTKAHIYAQSCPTEPAPDINSPHPPKDICIPDGTNEDQIKYFDHFSWQSLVALVWPADISYRGHPDPSKALQKKNDRDVSVFLTYKSAWEIFHKDQQQRKPWNSYEEAQFNVCNVNPNFGGVILAPVSKFGDVGQAGFSGLVGPLVAQNRTYVRYLTAFNETIFNQIEVGKFYLSNKIPRDGLSFQDGSINIKSAWIEMKNIHHQDRYYIRQAYVFDYGKKKCVETTVGLVGLHIVRKTEKRQQWIWATFEHLDNVPPAEPG